MKNKTIVHVVILLFIVWCHLGLATESDAMFVVNHAKSIVADRITVIKQLIDVLQNPVNDALDATKDEVAHAKQLVSQKREAIALLPQLAQSEDVLEVLFKYICDSIKYSPTGIDIGEHDDVGPEPTPAMKALSSLGLPAARFLIRKLERNRDQTVDFEMRFIKRTLSMIDDKEAVEALFLYAINHAKSAEKKAILTQAMP